MSTDLGQNVNRFGSECQQILVETSLYPGAGASVKVTDVIDANAPSDSPDDIEKIRLTNRVRESQRPPNPKDLSIEVGTKG
ncbi:hypothetical protein ScPMuIL_001051 [Solemya velum]